MGQSFSNGPSTPGRTPHLLTSQGTLRQSLKRVYSEELDESEKRSSSRSLPASPCVRKRIVAELPGNGSPSTSRAQPPPPSMTLESVLKNFEEFAQHQWPTWAKRRGWIAEFPPESTSTLLQSHTEGPSSTGVLVVDDGSGRVIQVDKDKWVFQRHHRPKCPPVDESVLTEKMVDILQIDESRASLASGGQRSRRSSGYASASNSPSAGHKRSVLTTHQHQVASADSSHQSLYEVTLRWMFDDVDLPPAVATPDAIPVHHKDSSSTTTSSVTTTILRIYLHLFRRNNKVPAFIDFCPLLPETCRGDEAVDEDRQSFGLLFQDGNPAPQTSFPRETACVELIRRIVQVHPLLVDCDASKLSLYEKSWRPGKTSRARLRRLNDFDCPLLLASQWNAAGHDSNCAKTLVLQESQNGDIPWEDFTVAELSSFLRVLEREEANHEMQIRERYQLLNDRLRQAMEISSSHNNNTTSVSKLKI